MFYNKHKFLILLISFVVGMLFLPTQAFAVDPDPSKPQCLDGPNLVECPTNRDLQPGKCYTVVPGVTPQDDSSYAETYCKNDCNSAELNKDNCGIVRYLLIFINVLSGLVGVVVVAMVIIGGIQYSTAQDNPNALSAAKGRIANALLALLAFLFMFAFLQWLVPGGLF